MYMKTELIQLKYLDWATEGGDCRRVVSSSETSANAALQTQMHTSLADYNKQLMRKSF